MASFETLQKLAAHPEWIVPRSDVRVFLGEPGAPEATKTTVEPGNVFSPGMKTFGVTWWVRWPETNQFFATETAPLEALQWSYEAGYLQLLHCDCRSSGLAMRHSLFQDGTAKARSEAVCGRLAITNVEARVQKVEVFIAIRSLGPAGGPLSDVSVDPAGRSFYLERRHLPLLGFDRSPAAIGCGVGDPSPMAQVGLVPNTQHAADQESWCFGLARFDVELAPGDTWQVHMECPIQTYGNLQEDMPSTAVLRPDQFTARAERHLAAWRARFGRINLDVPDPDFRNAFFAGLQHMLTATVGDQARIAPLSYPLPWLRDSVFIIRSFDLAGFHDLARRATEYCARNDFFGGFGAEGDAPGQGLWALIEHYRITRDKAWLEHIYPAIQRKCDWLFRMRRTAEPIQLTTDTPVLAFTHAERSAGTICIAARDGIIMGAMDHGVSYSLGWVNHWALVGLREAAFAAAELGLAADSERYTVEAEALQQALDGFTRHHPEFFDHERTVNSLLWPTRAWADPTRLEQVVPRFKAWWYKNRTRDGQFEPEPYWLYFEFAQAHNALLMGDPEPVWQVLNYRLKVQDLPGLYGWREGGDTVGTENATQGVTLINHLRGCHKFDSITPHGWSQAEFWLLQRAVLIEEWDDGLLLFSGISAEWLKPGARIAFDAFPTWYGNVSATLTVDASGHKAQVTLKGAQQGTPINLRLGATNQRYSAAEETTTMTIDLIATEGKGSS